MFCNVNLGNIYVNEAPDVMSAFFKKERLSSVSEEVSRVIDYLYNFAFVDLMTGLKNRNAYEETMRSLRSASSKLSGLRVVVIDVDRLKSINDNYGHDCGDVAIKTVGRCIAKAFDDEELLFRYGGDEFICMSYTDVSKNIKVFNQLINQEKFSFTFPLSASVGMAKYDKNVDTGIDALMKRCDEIMYSNKKAKKEMEFKIDFQVSVSAQTA